MLVGGCGDGDGEPEDGRRTRGVPSPRAPLESVTRFSRDIFIFVSIISPKSKGDVMVAIKGDRLGMGSTSSYRVLLSLGISVRRENLIK